MNIADLFKRAFARRIAYVLVAVLLSMIGIGRAEAQTTEYCNNAEIKGAGDDGPVVYCQTKQQAFMALQAVVARHGVSPRYGSEIKEDMCARRPCFTTKVGTFDERAWRVYLEGCPVGTEWFNELGQCDKPCDQRNADLGGPNRAPRLTSTTSDDCKGGCKYVVDGEVTTHSIFANLAGQGSVQTGQSFQAQWYYPGDRCTVTPPQGPPEEERQEQCTPASAGQTFCQWPNGNQCHTASTGRTICWTPGETGTKTDGSVSQTKSIGNQPPGTIEGSSHTSTTNVTTTNTSSSTSITINNHTTNNGSPAGPANQGTPAGSSGGPSNGSGSGSGSGPGTGPGDGDGDDENESSGGGDCDSPPVSSGDAILGQIAVQTWHTRCNTEKGTLSGTGECSEHGTVVGFMCTGDQVLCEQTLRARELACKAELARREWTGDGDTGEDEGDVQTVWGDGEEGPALDSGGFGWGRNCPQLPQVFGRSIQVPFLCDSLQLIGTLVLLLAYFHAGRIVAR